MMTMSLGHNVSECVVVYFGLVSQKRNLQCTSKEKVQDSVAKKIIKSPQKNMTKITGLRTVTGGVFSGIVNQLRHLRRS